MVFGIVHLVCEAVPGHGVRWLIAVPIQHVAFEHFDQTGAALHLAMCSHCAGTHLNPTLASTGSGQLSILKN